MELHFHFPWVERPLPVESPGHKAGTCLHCKGTTKLSSRVYENSSSSTPLSTLGMCINCAWLFSVYYDILTSLGGLQTQEETALPGARGFLKITTTFPQARFHVHTKQCTVRAPTTSYPALPPTPVRSCPLAGEHTCQDRSGGGNRGEYRTPRTRRPFLYLSPSDKA